MPSRIIQFYTENIPFPNVTLKEAAIFYRMCEQPEIAEFCDAAYKIPAKSHTFCDKGNGKVLLILDFNNAEELKYFESKIRSLGLCMWLRVYSGKISLKTGPIFYSDNVHIE